MATNETEPGVSQRAGISNGTEITDEPVYLMSAAVDDIRDISSVLNAINFKESAIMFFTDDGMKVSIDDAKCVQGSAFVPASVFQEFNLKKDFIAFQVNYNALVECINIYGHSSPDSVTAFKMYYGGRGSPLTLLIEDSGIVSECSLKTFEAREILDFEVSPSTYINKIVMRSEFLTEAWHDLDVTKDVLLLLLSPKEPYLQLSSKSPAGTVTISFPKDSDEIEHFQCTQTQENSYQMSLLRPSIKALHISSKVSFRTNEKGTLCLQYLIRTVNGHVCFIDFLCTPNVEDESDASGSS